MSQWAAHLVTLQMCSNAIVPCNLCPGCKIKDNGISANHIIIYFFPYKYAVVQVTLELRRFDSDIYWPKLEAAISK